MRLSIIVAASERGIIGNNGKIPWRIPADFRLFKSLTMGHTLIMGRKTFESIGKPLPGRTTIVVSRNANFFRNRALPVDVALMPSLVKAIEEAVGTNRSDETFICGGAGIYSAALPMVDRLYLTRVHGNINGDTRVPELDGGVPAGFVEIAAPVQFSRSANDDSTTHDATFHIYDKVEK